jgi:hypothetical protein
VSGYWLEDRAIEVRYQAEAKGIFLQPLCPDRLWGHPASCTMDTGVLSPGQSATGVWRWPLTPICCRGREWVGAIPPLPPNAFLACSGTVLSVYTSINPWHTVLTYWPRLHSPVMWQVEPWAGDRQQRCHAVRIHRNKDGKPYMYSNVEYAYLPKWSWSRHTSCSGTNESSYGRSVLHGTRLCNPALLYFNGSTSPCYRHSHQVIFILPNL